MENLTHTLVGLMMARCGLEKTTERGAGMMMLAANMPDMDAVFWFGGTIPYLQYHRTYTHSLVFMPLVALIPMLLVRAKSSWRAYLACMAGVLSHLVLDWTNSFGIPLVLPFSDHRFRLDIVNIVDIWVWLILLGGVTATILITQFRNTSPEMSSTIRRRWAGATLLALFSFEVLRVVSHHQAISVMESRLYKGAPARRVTALPVALTPFFWRGVIEGQDFVLITPVNLRSDYDPAAGRIYPTTAPIPEMDAALKTHPFQVFSRFAQLPYWEVMPVGDGVLVSLIDLRFGDPGRPSFAGVSAIVDRAGNVQLP